MTNLDEDKRTCLHEKKSFFQIAQFIWAKNKIFKKTKIHTFIIKTVDAIDACTFMIAP